MKRILVGVLAALACIMAAGPAWGAVQVLADFEDGTGLDYYDPDTNVAVASTDTPGGASTKSLKMTVSDWNSYDEGGDWFHELYSGLLFSPAIDLTQYTYINFYIKGSSTATGNGGWMAAPNANASAGTGFNSVSWTATGLPADWTYVSVEIAESSGWWKIGTDLAACVRLEFGFDVTDSPATSTIYLDHITLSDTPAEGQIPAGTEGEGEPDCEDPYIVKSSNFPIAGTEFSLSVAGLDAGCADSVVWTKDGEDVDKGICATISPAGAGAGTEVTVDLYDRFGQHVDMLTDVSYAEVGFADEQPERVMRFDHFTLSDTPANGMLGATEGFYLLSACEDGDLPSSLSSGELITTDSAGAGSTASVEMSVGGYNFIWMEYYGEEIDVSCCATYLNFYVKVVDGLAFDGWAGGGYGTNDWNEGGWLDDGAFTYPDPGGAWTYVSIALADMDPWGPPDFTALSAMGIEFGSNSNYYTFTTTDNPEAFATGSAVFTLTADMVASGRGWIWAEDYVLGGDISMEGWNPLADALTNGGNCGSAGAKEITGIGAGGLSLDFNPLSEADAGLYCATVTIDGVDTEVCASVAVLPEGTVLPVAGLLGLGVAAVACGVMGAFVVRRKKK